MKTKIAFFVLALTLLEVMPSQAGLFRIVNRNYGGASANVASAIDLIFDDLERQVNSNLPNAEVDNYLKNIADSAVISGAGVGVDYATQFDIAVAGVGAGAGAELGGASISDVVKGHVDASRIGGVAGQYSVMAGFHPKKLSTKKLSFLDLSRMKFFANAFSSSLKLGDVKMNFASFGAHAQYKLIPAAGAVPGLFRWNGIDVTSGLHYSFMGMGISKSTTMSATGSVPGVGTVTSRFSGTTRVDASSNIWTVPVEISTGVRVIHVVGLYGGLGADISAGKTDGQATVTGPVTVDTANVTADALMDVGSAKSPAAFAARYFAGAQLEAAVAALFVQYNHSLTNKTMGVAAGLRAFW